MTLEEAHEAVNKVAQALGDIEVHVSSTQAVEEIQSTLEHCAARLRVIANWNDERKLKGEV